jgi:hypothetical protein
MSYNNFSKSEKLELVEQLVESVKIVTENTFILEHPKIFNLNKDGMIAKSLENLVRIYKERIEEISKKLTSD